MFDFDELERVESSAGWPLAYLSVAELLQRLAQGTLTSVQLVRACLEKFTKDNGREPTDWMRYGRYGNTGLRSSEQAHSGSHSIKYTGGSWQLIENGPSDSASRLNLKKGQAYKVTFWARSTSSRQNIRTEFLNYPVTGSKSHYSSRVYTSSGSFVKTHHTSAANTWQQFTHTFTPSRDQPIVRLNIGPHGVSGSLYIDDVVLSPA